VGIEAEIGFKIQQTRMAPGDILLGYTDGVTEANTSDDTFFTMKRLLSLLETPASTATDLLDRIANSVEAHISGAGQFDDITLLAVRRIS
jgi:serine phosphatase RsbU (regulator of sigma subunit)